MCEGSDPFTILRVEVDLSNSGAEAMLRKVLVTLLSEALYGPRGDAFFLNSGDRGLVASLDALSAEIASARPGGRSSVRLTWSIFVTASSS